MIKRKSVLVFLLFQIGFVFGQSYFEQGLKLYFNGEDRKSIELFTKAIDSGQDLAKSYMMRGAAKTMLKEYPQAINDIKYSISLDSTNSKAFFYFGRIYFLQGFYSTALKHYDKAIAKGKADADVYDDRAMCKIMDGNFKAAIVDLDKAIDLNPKNENFYITRGYSKSELKMYKEAILDYDKSIQIQPSQKAHANRGLAWWYLKQYSEAVTDFSKSLTFVPNDSEVLYYRGLSYKSLGKSDLACQDFTKSAALGNISSKKEKNVNCGE